MDKCRCRCPADGKATTPHQQIARERATVRNVGWLVVIRGLQIAGGVFYAAIVPRLMGPIGYGKVALLVGLSWSFSMLADLGFTEVVGREVPRYTQAGDQHGLTAFFGRLLAIRSSVGLATAALYLLATTVWLRDLDWKAMVLISVAIVLRAPASLCFSLQLGLNRAARWGLGEIVRQWGYLLLMLPGYLIFGLRGAALGVLFLEIAVAIVGFVGVRSHIAFSALRLRFAGTEAYFRFGLVFYGGGLLTAVFESSGDILLRSIRGDYASVGFFRLAYSAYLMAAAGIPAIALAFAPLLAILSLENNKPAMLMWIERLLKWLAVSCMIVLLGTVLLGRALVPLVLGQAFRPVAPSLAVLIAGLIAVSLTSVANLAALTYNRPSSVLFSSIAQLIVFWLLGPLLVARFGGIGAAVAVLGALIARAAFSTIAMQRVAGYSLSRWFQVIGLGVIFLPLGLVRASLLVNVGLLCVSIIGYAGLLYLFRIVTIEELSMMKSAVRRQAPL
jgi:O-antigen/teichoic acid export membrane protein